jgi:peptidoglycan-associated lipoprotein
MKNKTQFILAALWIVSLFAWGCGPRYPNCENDGQCKDDEYCVNSLCQECRDDGDCSEDMKCANGACRNLDYCEVTGDCGDGQVCRDNRCGPCVGSDECPSGMSCVDGACKKPDCVGDEQCPAGLYCKDGVCKPQETASVTGELGACDPESIYFDFDSAKFDSSMKSKLERNYECLMKNGGSAVLEGHCDPRGTTEYNMALGERRARTAKKLLSVMGIDSGRLRVVSKGEEEAHGHNEQTWAEDRRVDFQ